MIGFVLCGRLHSHGVRLIYTHAIDLYIGYFGQVTKYACILHKYPCGFVFVMIDKSFFMID